MVAFCVLMLTVLYGVFYTYGVLPRIYSANAQIEVFNVSGPAGTPSTEPRTDLERMQSPEVMAPIVTDLNLDKIWVKRDYHSKLEQLPMQDSLLYMSKITRLTLVPGTNIIRITVASEVPKEAADIANAIADRYDTVAQKEAEELHRRSEDALEAQMAGLENVMGEKKSAVDKLRGKLSEHPAATSTSALAAADLMAFQDAEHLLTEQQQTLEQMGVQLRRITAENRLNDNPVRIISRAEPPEYPFAPDHALNIMIAAIVGVFLGGLIASLLELAIWYLIPVMRAAETVPRGSSPSMEY